MKISRYKSLIDELYSDLPVSKILKKVFKCDYVFIFTYDKQWNSVIERVKRTSPELELLDYDQGSLGIELVKSASNGPQILDNKTIKRLGLKSDTAAIVASIGESAFVSGAVVMAKNQAIWDKADLKRFNMVLLLIVRLFELSMALEGNKKYADTIVGSVDTAVLAISQNGILGHFNKAAEKLFGFPASQAIGKHYMELSSLMAMKLTKNTFDYVMRTGIPWEGEFIEFIRLDNQKILISPSFYPWFSGDGGKLGVICVVRDETQAKRLQDQLVKSERMAILGKIAAKVSDDIKSPLSSIKNLALMIGNNSKPRSKHKSYTETMIEEADRINSSVNALLESSRLKESDYELVDINRVLRKALRISKIDRRKVLVVQNYTHKLTLVEGNKQVLEHVFLNLLNNAYESLDENDGLIEITTFLSNDYKVFVRIKDNGCGIPEEMIDKIFKPYFTTKKMGIGLGLSIVQKHVESHQGNIKITSEVGTGTCFETEFPIERNSIDEH